MYWYEIIYETGEHSVISAEDDDTALRGIAEQHRRAASGEAGGPSGIIATRVKRVLKYNEPPGSRYESQAVPTKELEKWLESAIKKNAVGDLVSLPEVIASLRDEVDPLVESSPHESNFKMQEVSELDSKLWEVAA